MADYCTISDVNNLIPQFPFTSTTTPTQTQVAGFITDVSTIINASIANLGYVVPVPVNTAPLSAIILRRMTSSGALGMALQVRITAVAPDQTIGNNVWTLRFEKWLTALKDNTDPFELPDAPRTGKQVVKPLGELQRDPTVSSIDSGGTSDPLNYLTSPTFYIGMPF